ncbi:hypothetical protein, partial [Bifidobacterium lemurum]
MNSLKKICCALMAAMLAVFSFSAFASDDTSYTLGEDSLVNTGKDNGYSKENAIDKDDPHWGWTLGRFYVKGYTRQATADGKPLFLKNTGDKVSLWFSLSQDIDRLNGDDKLSIAQDKDGWDQKMGISQQDFARGALIVKQTDYQNNTKTNIYTDFLSASSTDTADTKVEVFEEGDYEVVLDYKIKRTRLNVFGWKPLPAYSDYRISFAFSVLNFQS